VTPHEPALPAALLGGQDHQAAPMLVALFVLAVMAIVLGLGVIVAEIRAEAAD
jgi:hypothetical protein